MGARNTESQTDSMAETVMVAHAERRPARAKIGADFSHGDPTAANANRSPATTALIQGKQRIFSRIWGNFKVITQIAKTCGAQVYWETTTSNAYRHFTYVKETMEKYQFIETHFDGCMFGQMHPIKTECCATKPWTILHLNINNFPAKMMQQN